MRFAPPEPTCSSDLATPLRPRLPVIPTGSPAPDFSLPSDNGHAVSLTDLRGRWVVLFFYPKDDTSG